MKLSITEFNAMQSLPRRWGQKYFEMPMFKRIGLNVTEKDVLEIGCGSGYGAHLLHHAFRPKSYTGVDIMEEQIHLAQKDFPQYQFVLQSAEDLSRFESASRDVVIIFGVLHHIHDWRKTVDEIARVLRPNGRLFLEEPRGVDIKIFDFFFRWAHPDTDFGLHALEAHLTTRNMLIQTKQWTPLLTMYHAVKRA